MYSMKHKVHLSRHVLLLILCLSAASMANAQTYTTFGIGIDNPVGTLHVHSDYMHELVEPARPLDPYEDYYETVIRLTNTSTGATLTDGFEVRQRNKNLQLLQHENSSIELQTPGGSLLLTALGKVSIGGGDTTHRLSVNGAGLFNGRLTVNGAGIFSDTLRVGSNISLQPNGSIYGDKLFLGNGIEARSTGVLKVSSYVRVCEDSVRIACNGVTVGGDRVRLKTNGDIIAQGSARLGSGFYCDASGNLKVKSLRVTLTDWPDYVFDDGYRLALLGEVESYINENGHLPQMPSAAEVEENGVDMGEMNRLLMQKVEELTLYVIDLQKQLDELKSNR